jgi:hypothetical protein
MMELQAGTRVYYQAAIIRESHTEIRVLFPGGRLLQESAENLFFCIYLYFCLHNCIPWGSAAGRAAAGHTSAPLFFTCTVISYCRD